MIYLTAINLNAHQAGSCPIRLPEELEDSKPQRGDKLHSPQVINMIRKTVRQSKPFFILTYASSVRTIFLYSEIGMHEAFLAAIVLAGAASPYMSFTAIAARIFAL